MFSYTSVLGLLALAFIFSLILFVFKFVDLIYFTSFILIILGVTLAWIKYHSVRPADKAKV